MTAQQSNTGPAQRGWLTQSLGFLAAGLGFGFILSRAGATDYDAILGMFALTDLHLMGVIGVAVVVAGAGIWVMKRRARLAGAPTPIRAKALKPGLILGGFLFGSGWALTGTCPGTALSQLGEGKLIAIATVGGILAGTWLYGRFGGIVEGWFVTGRPAAKSAHPKIVQAIVRP
ncbi:MAG: putative membrane protein YedE/YeeE [Myxococcota bacterium]|jgi:uncharacterized membrane protein YedE/YeeE